MDLGELVIGNMMGAYTVASATHFNLLKRAKVVLVNGLETAIARAMDPAQAGYKTSSDIPEMHMH